MVALCSTVFGAKATVEHLKGGDYNRVMGISVPDGDYVVRIPRPWVVPIEYAVGPVKLMEGFPEIPTPTAVAWDAGRLNELGDPYLILTRLRGQRLDEVYGSLPHEARCLVAQDLGRVFANLGKIRNGNFGRVIWNGDVQVEPWFSCESDTTPSVPLTLGGNATESTAAMIEAALGVRWDRRVRGEDSFCQVLSASHKQMQQAGAWEDIGSSYVLSHGDLEPRNLLFGETGITDVVDWDGARFAPQLFSCVAPWWLWDWENYQWHEDPVQLEPKQAAAKPPTPECEELKLLFDEAAGQSTGNLHMSGSISWAAR